MTLLAARATFRVLPNLVWTLEKEKPEDPAPLAMLWTLRCLISAISAILSGDAELIEATKRAAAFTQSLGHSTAISNAYYTARSVERGRSGKLLAIGVLDNPQFAKPERWREIELDAKSIDERSHLDSLMRVPIWRTAPPSDLAPDQRFFERLKQILGAPASEFWNQWLVEIYEGRAKNWELYREICLIDDAIWRAGPEAVAEEIAEIRARWEVEKALSDIKGSLTVRRSARLGIGGNNPPESIEDERLSGAITLIWEATEDLSTALEEERPAREWIEAILAKFKSGLAGFLKWCAGKGDLAVDTLIKWGIPATGAGYAANYPEKIEALIKAIEDWLPFLS